MDFSKAAVAGVDLSVSLLTGCAPQSSYSPAERQAAVAELLADKTPPQPAYTAPVCYSSPQCGAMWSEALVQLESLSRMRIQTATDSFAQTYRAVGYNTQSGRIRKIPQPDGSTIIDAEFFCDYCGSLSNEARVLFASSVMAAGYGFDTPGHSVPPAKTAATPAQSADDYRKAFGSPAQ
ncbi:hypothetical protein ACIPL1_24880 [Pseudomonas sp. NPDC090202]|uniref:hypothetical protein n=1 Tax=Pseudomonas sp. NPDC090202 TaxID=3364476 RepID=UPI003808BC64